MPASWTAVQVSDEQVCSRYRLLQCSMAVLWVAMLSMAVPLGVPWIPALHPGSCPDV